TPKTEHLCYNGLALISFERYESSSLKPSLHPTANSLFRKILPIGDWFQRFYLAGHRSTPRKLNKARILARKYDLFPGTLSPEPFAPTKQNAPDSFESGAYVDQPSPKCCSIRRLIGSRASVNGYNVPLSRTSRSLRLLLHFERGRGPVQLIGVIHVDRLPVLRNSHAVDPDHLPVALVDLLNRVRRNPLQRNQGVPWISLNRVVFAIELRIVAFAVWVRHFQSIRRALIGHSQPVVRDAIHLRGPPCS